MAGGFLQTLGAFLVAQTCLTERDSGRERPWPLLRHSAVAVQEVSGEPVTLSSRFPTVPSAGIQPALRCHGEGGEEHMQLEQWQQEVCVVEEEMQ